MLLCDRCKQATARDAVFCQHCGARLVALQDLPVLRRERKWVSILFADVRGSMTLISHLDPEQAHELLSPAVQLMKAAVERHGGITNRVIGDGIMALFGAPIGIEDHAARACAAALEMLKLVKEWQSAGDPNRASVEIRVGINTGEVFVHPTVGFGSSFYDATGEAVHMAARMEQNAGANQAFISARTYAEVRGEVEADDLGDIPIKGLDAPVRAHRLTRLSRRWRSRDARTGRRSPFVGRHQELALLRELQYRVESGQGSALLITGDAGSGKSRLVTEFADQLDHRRWQLHRCQSQPHRKTAFRGIADLLERLSGLDFDRGDALEVDMRWLPEATSPEDRIALAVIVGLTDADVVWRAIEPRERRQRLDGATLRLLNLLAAGQPTLLIVEDAHWLDEESAALIERFCADLVGRPILVLVTSRGEAEFAGTRLNLGVEQHLPPLSADDAGTMLRAAFQRGPAVADLERKLVELARGNPLFLEECLYSLLSRGALKRENDKYVLLEPIQDLRVPTSLRGLIAARVDRVDQEQKNILQAAAVVGAGITIPLLADLVPQAGALHESIEQLCANGFLVAQSATALDFRHGLTREAVYESIPFRQRNEMHAAILARVETWEGDHVELLADHALRGQAFDKAAIYCRRSGNKAFMRDSKEEAIRFLRQGLEATSQWPLGPERDSMEFDLHLDLRNPLFQLARIDELSVHLDRAMPIAEALGDPVRLGRYYPYLSHLSWFRGDSQTAINAVEATLRIAASQNDKAMAARAKFQAGTVRMSQGRLSEAVDAMSDVLVYLKTNSEEYQYGVNASLAVTTLSYIARAQADAGQDRAAWKAADEAFGIASGLENPFATAFALTGLGYCHLRLGSAAAALDPLERAYKESTSGYAPLMIPVAAAFLAWALADSGDSSRAMHLSALAIEEAERMGFRVFHPVRLFVRAHCLARAGLMEEAKRAAEDGMRLAETQDELGAKAHAMRVLGEVQLAAGAAEAISTLTVGQRLAQRHALLPLAAEFEASLVKAKSMGAGGQAIIA